jgi:hypothetical protein
VRWTWTNWEEDDPGDEGPPPYPINPRVIETSVGDNANNVKRTAISYKAPPPPFIMEGYQAYFGLVDEVKIYDANSALQKKTKTEYNLDSPYMGRRIIGLPSQTLLYDQNGTLMSKIMYAYDEATRVNFQTVTPVQHDDQNYGTGMLYRGNLTSSTRCDVSVSSSTTCNGGVTSHVKYDTAGSPVAQIDPLGRATTISYADNFNSSGNPITYAYPTTVTDAGDNSSMIQYRYDLGANVWARSPKPDGPNNTYGKTTSRTYNDTTGRIEKEKIENTGAYTRYDYANTGNALTTYSTIVDTAGSGEISSADEVATETLFDGAGRVRKTRTENPGSYGGWTGKLIEYDILGQVKRETVPTEIDSSWQPAGDDNRGSGVWLWNSKEYDWKGRVTMTIPSDSITHTINNTNSDGKETIISYAGCGCAGGQVTTIQGPQVDAIDLGGTTTVPGRKTQKIREDILGRTVATEIWSLNGGSLYSSTTNEYNGRDQVTKVIQSDSITGTHQDTEVTYDGHGRPVTLHKPEWYGASASDKKFTTTTYNIDDTVATVTEPRGVVTNYTYGNPGATEKRAFLTRIDYATPTANPTPGDPLHIADVHYVTFDYDHAGNRATMVDGTGTLSYQYDELSRLTAEKKYFSGLPGTSTDGSYTLSYTYYLAGGLRTVTEPFGHTTTYSADKLGRTTSIDGSGTDGSINYASNIQRRAFGGVKGMTLGTTANTAITMDYDSALRPTTYQAVNSTTGSNFVQKASYSYQNDGMSATIDNLRDGSSVNTFDQSNVYDFAARLKQNNVGPSGGSFLQTMNYDAFSDLTRRVTAGGAHADQFDATYSNNRKISGGSNDINDAAGNVVHSDTASDIKNWNFDAVGRVAHWDEHGPWSSYPATHEKDFTYDGDGRAVKTQTLDSRGVATRYYFYSTVTGQNITDMVGGASDASFDGSRVYLDGTLIYDTSFYEDSQDRALGFTVTDPVSRSTQELYPSGAVPLPTNDPHARNELAGLGTYVPTDAGSASEWEPGRGGNPSDAEGGCVAYVDHFQTTCNKALSSLGRENGKLLSDVPTGFPYFISEHSEKHSKHHHHDTPAGTDPIPDDPSTPDIDESDTIRMGSYDDWTEEWTEVRSEYSAPNGGDDGFANAPSQQPTPIDPKKNPCDAALAKTNREIAQEVLNNFGRGGRFVTSDSSKPGTITSPVPGFVHLINGNINELRIDAQLALTPNSHGSITMIEGYAETYAATLAHGYGTPSNPFSGRLDGTKRTERFYHNPTSAESTLNNLFGRAIDAGVNWYLCFPGRNKLSA